MAIGSGTNPPIYAVFLTREQRKEKRRKAKRKQIPHPIVSKSEDEED